MKVKVKKKNQSILQLLKTISQWEKEVNEKMNQSLEEENIHYANYLAGKKQAYKDTIDLLQTINTNKIPFKL